MRQPIPSQLSIPIDVHVNLVGRRNLTQEIYRQLRAAILDGRLRAGDRLPATRELAQRLAVEEGLARLRAAFSRRDSR